MYESVAHTCLTVARGSAFGSGGGFGAGRQRFNVIKDPGCSYEQDEPQRSVDSIRGLPLPASCLLPLGHTAVLRCQPNVNYSPVFLGNFLFPPHLFLTCGLSLYFGLLSVCLSAAGSVPPPLPSPSHPSSSRRHPRGVQGSLVCVPAVCVVLVQQRLQDKDV